MNKILQHVSEKEKIDEHNQRKTSKVDWVCSLLWKTWFVTQEILQKVEYRGKNQLGDIVRKR